MLRDSEEIKRLLKALRAEKGLNGNEMSKRLNLSPGTYNKKENHPDIVYLCIYKRISNSIWSWYKKGHEYFFYKIVSDKLTIRKENKWHSKNKNNY